MTTPDYIPSTIWVGVSTNPFTNGSLQSAKPPTFSLSEETIRRWAAEDPAFRVIFSVDVPPDIVLYRVEKVPETTRLVAVETEDEEASVQ